MRSYVENGIEHAERVGKAEAAGASRLCVFDDALEEVEVGARRILAADADVESGVQGQMDMAA